MEMVMTTSAKEHPKLQSNRHHQKANIELYTGWMPFLSLNEQCRSTERNGVVY